MKGFSDRKRKKHLCVANNCNMRGSTSLPFLPRSLDWLPLVAPTSPYKIDLSRIDGLRPAGAWVLT